MTMIHEPGKFEGEPTYARHFYDIMLDGGGDDTLCDNDTLIEVFIVTDEDRRLYPDLVDVYAVGLQESDSGFVYTQEFTDVESLQAFEAVCEVNENEME